MQVGIMATNNGPHPPGKWALVTVGQIMQGVFGIRNAENTSQRKLELAMLDVLEHHHGKVQTHERGKLAEHGVERLAHPLDPSEHLDDPVAALVEAAKAMGQVEMPDPEKPGTTILADVAAHFAKPEVQEQLRLLIGRHFASVMDIERSRHADQNADDPTAKVYRAARTEHGGHHAHQHVKAHLADGKPSKRGVAAH